MQPIACDGHMIGPGHPTFIAAEVGLNHNGDLDRAKELIREAARAGVDAVKFQNYRTEDFLHDKRLTYTYRSQGKEITESQWDMFKRCEPDPAWWPELRDLARAEGLVFFSTPTGTDGIDELVKLDVPLIKNGSDYLTHLPFIRHMARTGIPVVLSTGMADAADIDAAVAAAREAGPSPLLLLHCTSSYPTPRSETNLRRMTSLAARYQVPVGFSDHTAGATAAAQATTLGACFIEKHYTLDRELPGPDHWFSSTPDELRELVDEVRAAEERLGSDAIAPATAEAVGRLEYRVGLVANRLIREGETLQRTDIVLRRPSRGLLPKDLENAIGRTLRRTVEAGQPLTSEDLA